MTKVSELFHCKKPLSSCEEVPMNISEYYPRSYRHNMVSKSGHLRKKKVDRKFFNIFGETTSGEVIYLPSKQRKLKRLSGPAVEEVIHGSQVGLGIDYASETDISMEKLGSDEETVELLEELSKRLNAEEMNLLAVLGGDDICPCCKYTICSCELRNITSEMVLMNRELALLREKGKCHYEFYSKNLSKFDSDSFKEDKQKTLQKTRTESIKHENIMVVEDQVIEEIKPADISNLIEHTEIQVSSKVSDEEGQTVWKKESNTGERRSSIRREISREQSEFEYFSYNISTAEEGTMKDEGENEGGKEEEEQVDEEKEEEEEKKLKKRAEKAKEKDRRVKKKENEDPWFRIEVVSPTRRSTEIEKEETKEGEVEKKQKQVQKEEEKCVKKKDEEDLWIQIESEEWLEIKDEDVLSLQRSIEESIRNLSLCQCFTGYCICGASNFSKG